MVAATAVCAHARFVPLLRDALAGSDVRTCTVAAGFPDAHGTLRERVAEVSDAHALGADEIDVVVDIDLVRAAAWAALFDELLSLYEQGRIAPPSPQAWPLEEAGAALRALMDRKVIGKGALTVGA